MKSKHLLTMISFLIASGALTHAAQCQEAPARGLFVSVIQRPSVLESRQAIDDLVSFAKKSGCKTLFVQIYRENKAWFPSKVGDTTPYENCRKNVGQDAFELLLRKAHAQKLRVHAWINLLSLGANTEAPLLKKYGPEILTRNTKEKKSLEDYRIDKQFFLEPGDPRIQKELSELVTEILRTYPALDGIQFDYIRYPDKDPAYGYTAANVARYKKSSKQESIDENSNSWKSWKYAQVTELVRKLAKIARTLKPDIQVSTTGLVPYSRASLESFQDWRAWVKTGLIDFVTLMNYATTAEEFGRNIEDARKNLGNLKKTNMAVGAYALPGSSGTFKDLVRLCEKNQCRACVVFHYGSLVDNPELAKIIKR